MEKDLSAAPQPVAAPMSRETLLKWLDAPRRAFAVRLTGWLAGTKAAKRRARRITVERIKQLPKIDRDRAHFLLRYPAHAYGIASYGVPVVKDYGWGGRLEIGAYCSIAEGVKIMLGGGHHTDWVTTAPLPALEPRLSHIPILDYGTTRANVLIGNDVWVCLDATILTGVTVGHGAVIAAGAMVTRDVPAYAVVAGVPAKVVGWRFPEAIRTQLLATAWWDWPYDEVVRMGETLCSTDTAALLAYAAERHGREKSTPMT